MSTPAENPEKTPKKPNVGKILYGVTVGALAVVMMVAGFLYLKQSQPEETEPTVQQTWLKEPTVPTTLGVYVPTEPVIPEPPVEEGEPEILLKEFTQPVSLLSQAAKDYLAAENVKDVTEFVSRYWEIESRSDLGRPVELAYTIHALPEGVEVETAVFRLFHQEGGYTDYAPAQDSRRVYIYNLCTGTEYQYSGIFTLTDGTVLTLPGSFQTEAGPRLMNISGLVNVRDLGGWLTTDGKTVKQGLLYRGCELDGMVESGFKLTAEGLEQMNALGIKTDFDLRHEGENVLAGEHYYYDAIQYEHAFSDAGREAVRRLFADLADPANYPAYLHCTYGADRTGTMCYLLLGLLGVEDVDLKRDYELTAMYYGYVSPAQMDAFVQKINDLPGENTQAKVEYFLNACGVTQAQMESIRQIFLG